MLVRTNLIEPQGLPFRDLRQGLAFALIVALIVFAVGRGHRQLVHAQVAVKFLHRAGRAEGVIARGNVDRGLIENRREHLRGHETLPDQLVQFELIVRKILAHFFRGARNVRRPNGFVRFLRVLL